MAIDLAERGYDIVVHCNNSIDQADEVAAEIQALGRRAHVVQADLTDSSTANASLVRSIRNSDRSIFWSTMPPHLKMTHWMIWTMICGIGILPSM